MTLADDHYELDISRARKLLDWEPKHSLRDALPAIIKELKADPLSWYKRNKLTPAEWIETMAAQSEPADQFLEAYNRSMRERAPAKPLGTFSQYGHGYLADDQPAHSGLSRPGDDHQRHDQRRSGVFVGRAIAVANDGVGAHRQRGGRAVAVVRAPGLLDAKRFGLSQ